MHDPFARARTAHGVGRSRESRVRGAAAAHLTWFWMLATSRRRSALEPPPWFVLAESTLPKAGGATPAAALAPDVECRFSSVSRMSDSMLCAVYLCERLRYRGQR